MRFLPDQSPFKTGTDGNVRRDKTKQKHMGVATSLVRKTTHIIRALDEHATTRSGRVMTLREMLHELRWPLQSDPADSELLIFSADLAVTGRDRNRGIYNITSYVDRADVTNSIIDILPAYVSFMHGKEAMKTWCTPNVEDIVDEVTFSSTNPDEWDGTWSTLEDDMENELLQEDIGFDLSQFDLDMLYDEETRRPIKEDAQTVTSFGTALGKRQQEDDESTDEQTSLSKTADNNENAVKGNANE